MQREAATWVKVSDLKPWVKNPRKNDMAVERIADSIKRFGFGSPIIARKENMEIIAGHTRLKAAIFLGLKDVPVRFLDLSEKDAHLLSIADNKLGEIAEWDNDLIKSFADSISLDEALSVGWNEKEIEEIFSDKKELEKSEKLLREDLLYQVVVECDSEQQQISLIENLEVKGFKCRPLIS